MTKESAFKTYVPTKWGGVLTISTTAGTIKNVKYPDGSAYATDTETGKDKQGWYTFRVTGAQTYTVSCTFYQEGEVPEASKPWNAWFWSYKSDRDPNFYDDDSVLDKYDDFVGQKGTWSSAKKWEEQNRQSKKAWEGFCHAWMGAAAVEPKPSAGDDFSLREAKGLVLLTWDKIRTVASLVDYSTYYVRGGGAGHQSKWRLEVPSCAREMAEGTAEASERQSGSTRHERGLELSGPVLQGWVRGT